VRLAKKLGVSLANPNRRVGKLALIKQQRYAHAISSSAPTRACAKLKTYLAALIRDLERKIVGNEGFAGGVRRPRSWPARVNRSAARRRKVYSLHARSRGIGKGKSTGTTSSASR